VEWFSRCGPAANLSAIRQTGVTTYGWFDPTTNSVSPSFFVTESPFMGAVKKPWLGPPSLILKPFAFIKGSS
jgi:hypothetical protein